MNRFVCIICCLLTSVGVLLAEPRSWENSEGVRIEAALVRIEGADALLRMHGRIFRVPVAQLSAADQAFIIEWQERRNASATTAETPFGTRQAARPEPGSKKGYGLSMNRFPDWPDRLETLTVSWFYNWTAREPAGIPEGIEFIPMVFGHANRVSPAVNQLRQVAGHRNYPYVLGHNEPDSPRQANRSVEDVLDEWPQLMEIGLPLVSPSAINPEGEWMKAFMAGVEERGLRVDFIGVHSYGGPNARGFLNRLERIHQLYGRPIWITEFGVGDWQAEDVSLNRHSPERILNFMREVLPELDRRPYIHRYAWFNADPSNAALGTSALFDEDGNLTPLGEFYANHR